MVWVVGCVQSRRTGVARTHLTSSITEVKPIGFSEHQPELTECVFTWSGCCIGVPEELSIFGVFPNS